MWINGPGVVNFNSNEFDEVIVLHWALDGSCDCIIVQVWFWIELPIQRRLCPIFMKLWIPVNVTQRCGIELHDIHRLSVG